MRASPFNREALALAHMIKQCEGTASMSKFPREVWTDLFVALARTDQFENLIEGTI